jgi:DNA-binding IclR family transcriptional regulator
MQSRRLTRAKASSYSQIVEQHPIIRNGSGTVDKAMSVLMLVAKAQKPIGVSECATQIGLPRATTHRLLQSLTGWGLLQQTSDHQYALGALVLELSTLYLGGSDIRSQYRLLLEFSRDLSGEAACLVVRQGLSRVCIEYAPSKQRIAYNPQIGETLPITVGATGRAFLSDLPVDRQVELLRDSPVALASRKQLNSVLRLVEEGHARGYFVSCSERIEDMNGIAVPLRNSDGSVQATISVVGPASRWTVERIHEIAPQIAREAQRYTHVQTDLQSPPVERTRW